MYVECYTTLLASIYTVVGLLCDGCLDMDLLWQESVVIVDCAGNVADSGSQKVFGGSVTSAGFGQLASKNAGQLPAVFGSMSAVGGQTPSFSSAIGSGDSSSVFGSGTKVVGFSDLAASGSGVGDFTTKSGLFLTYSIFHNFYCIVVRSHSYMRTCISMFLEINCITIYMRVHISYHAGHCMFLLESHFA